MSSSIIIPIEGRIDEDMVQRVKRTFQKIAKKDSPLIALRIFSHGGNLWPFSKLSGFLYFMLKIRGCKIVGQAGYAESAAFLLFINCPIRQVTSTSIGVIHLPELAEGKDFPLSSVEKKRQEVIRFIKKRTGLSEETIRNLEGKRLNADQMLSLGIATEKVHSFSGLLTVSEKAA